MDHDEDRDLLLAWRAGDSRAGDELLQRHIKKLRTFFINKAPDQELDELIQETLLGCVASMDRFRGDATFSTFLFQIARKKLVDFYRKRKRAGQELDLGEISLADIDPGPSSILAMNRQQQLIVQALRRIPIDDQIVLELFYWEGLTARELGAIYEIVEPTMRGRLKRAKDQLRQQIEHLAKTPQELQSTLEDLEGWARRIREHREEAAGDMTDGGESTAGETADGEAPATDE